MITISSILDWCISLSEFIHIHFYLGSDEDIEHLFDSEDSVESDDSEGDFFSDTKSDDSRGRRALG